MIYDSPERRILRIARLYSKDETVAGMRLILSKVQIELGMSQAYAIELEEKIKELEKKIRLMENKVRKAEKQVRFIEKANSAILARQKATELKSDPFFYPSDKKQNVND